MEIGIIRPAELKELMETAYLDYSMSVIVSRALPDVRDGLKPVQRRILYAMNNIGLRHDAPYRKSAGIVGEVLKEYHPHGDSAVYDAQVRLAQDFSMRYPLVDGQGNYGSVDGDPAAAMRYTEARLSAVAEEILADIKKETVPFAPNYDEKTTEPAVLPARLPNLLLNGSTGIAVGMATNIPPHNLGEVVAAITHLIDYPDADVEALIERLPGPDFPTGGVILGREGIREAYATGKGRIQLRGKAHIEDGRGGRYSIIITELPFQVNKASLSERIAELIDEDRIPGAHIVRDESDRTGMRLVVELKRDADPKQVMSALYRLTPLQSTFGINMLALVNGNEPRVLTLKKALQSYIDWRFEVITRRCEHDLREARQRAHILEGLKIALDNLNAVIKLIRESMSTEEAKRALIARFKLSDLQAQAILDMRLARLAALERQKIEEEYKAVLKEIASLEDTLAHPKKIYRLIKADLSDLNSKYGDARRTIILEGAGDDVLETEAEQAPDLPALVAITNRGYIKRMTQDAYKRQRRSAASPAFGVVSRDPDAPQFMVACSTLDSLVVVASSGRAYVIKANDVPFGERSGKGVPVGNVASLEPGERVAGMVVVRDFSANRYLSLVTKEGRIKKTALGEYAAARSSGVISLTLDHGDEVIGAGITTGKDYLILATTDGQAIHFSEEDVRPVGRAAAGVAGIKLSGGATVVSMDVVSKTSKEHLLVLTSRGMGKRVAVAEFPQQGRAGGGVRAIPLTPKTGDVRLARVVSQDDDLLVITAKGQVVRTFAEAVPSKSRAAVSVPVVQVDPKDEVVGITRVPRATQPSPASPKSTSGGPRSNGATDKAQAAVLDGKQAGSKASPVSRNGNGHSNGSEPVKRSKAALDRVTAPLEPRVPKSDENGNGKVDHPAAPAPTAKKAAPSAEKATEQPEQTKPARSRAAQSPTLKPTPSSKGEAGAAKPAAPKATRSTASKATHPEEASTRPARAKATPAGSGDKSKAAVEPQSPETKAQKARAASTKAAPPPAASSNPKAEEEPAKPVRPVRAAKSPKPPDAEKPAPAESPKPVASSKSQAPTTKTKSTEGGTSGAPRASEKADAAPKASPAKGAKASAPTPAAKESPAASSRKKKDAAPGDTKRGKDDMTQGTLF